ncbi:MAG TPA: acyl-CoA thioesterase [Desulfovibrio sp.]|jgi:acyl-CoA hydrolase|uniref:acyl-CoA thioesterase n=1 Tax=Desulfovibrio TaxID=872 RepID=UPI0004210248|nr:MULTISPECIES: acyl-CoA thioesterase [Desulfovibrio]MDY0306320.1 acyl-CoA thioesterase [Desulfovibrionaceae bacterium]HMM38887.1 acyl-CoA thioesterase [Desulfovibrio sp.]
MNGKTPAQTAVTMAHLILPSDANPAGNCHGGVVLKYIDICGAIVAKRHCRKNVVTASMDRTDFLAPVHVGEMVILKASLNMVGRTSMEVGVRVEAENLMTGEVRHTNSAYVTYVCMGEDGKPHAVPPMVPETDEDRRRMSEAQMRRKLRQEAKSLEKKRG